MTLNEFIKKSKSISGAATKRPWSTYDNGFDGFIVSEKSEIKTEDTIFKGPDAGKEYKKIICGGEPSEGRVEPDDPDIQFIVFSTNHFDTLIRIIETQQKTLELYAKKDWNGICMVDSHNWHEAKLTLDEVEKIIK